jgi:hypothetical protein
MPRDRRSIGKRGQRVANHARVISEASDTSDLSVRGHATGRHAPHDRVDPRIRCQCAAVSALPDRVRGAAPLGCQEEKLPWMGQADAGTAGVLAAPSEGA